MWPKNASLYNTVNSGLALQLFSSLCLSIRCILNKKYICDQKKYNARFKMTMAKG